MEIAALLNQAQLNSLASPSSSSSSSSTSSSSSSSSPSLISLHAAKKSHINVNNNHNHPSSSTSSSSISSSPQPSSLLSENRHRKSNSVLHVRENSLDELEALFDPSRRTSRANLPPLHKRNLPSSFFTQPSANSPKQRHSHRLNHHHHGRQMSSIDQSTYSSAKYNNQDSLNHGTNVSSHSMNPFNGGNQMNGNGLVVTTANTSLQPMSANNHLRSISEPVNMMNMNGSQIQVEPQPLQQLHQNILNNSQNAQLPYGWQSAKTSDNRVYYINHLTNQTSWTLPNQASFQQQQQQQPFDLNEDNFDLISLGSAHSTPSASLLMNANLVNDSDMLNGNKLQSNGVLTRMNPLVSMDKNNLNTNVGLLSIQSSNSLISSSVSSLSSSSSISSHSGSLSQDETPFDSHQSQLKHHHSNHHQHHPHHHHPYLTQHHLNQQGHFQHSSSANGGNNEAASPIQLSIHNLNTLKSLTDYQQKVEYLLKLTPMPSDWHQSQTDTGEIFFINHATRSTSWDPRLKIVENYLQKHEKILHQQQHHHHDLDFSSLHPTTNQSIPVYQQQMNSRSNSTGAASSSSCTSSNSASPLFMLNSSGSGMSSVLNNSNNNSLNATSNEIMGIENGLMHQQKKLEEFPAMLEANGDSNFQHQDRINTLLDIISKKKELIKSLNELNKKESFLRSQLDIYGPGFLNGLQNTDVIYSTNSSSNNGPLSAPSNEKLKRSFSPSKTKPLQKSVITANHTQLVDENLNVHSDDDEVDLSNPEMTFISSENNETVNEQPNENNSKFLQLNPHNNVNNANNSLKLNKKPKHEPDTNEADVDTVNNLYNKLLIHNTNTNKNFINIKMDENGSTMLNEDNRGFNPEIAALTSNSNRLHQQQNNLSPFDWA